MPCSRMQHTVALPWGKSCSAYAANAIASTWKKSFLQTVFRLQKLWNKTGELCLISFSNWLIPFWNTNMSLLSCFCCWWHHCLLSAIIFCRFHVIGVSLYPTFTLHYLISSYLLLPYILPYLTSYLTFRYFDLYLTLPYLTFCLTLPYPTLPQVCIM